MKVRRLPLRIGYAMLVLLILFVGVSVVRAGAIAWFGPIAISAHHQQRIVSRLESLGAKFRYEDNDEYKERPCSFLMKCLLGDHAHQHVVTVGLSPTEPLNDDDLALLTELPEISDICLEGRHITDRAMHYVAQLPRLEVLGLISTSVTAEGLAQLNRVDSLERLLLGRVTVTDDLLKSFGTLNSLRTLGFMECRFQSADFGCLASLPHLSQLAIMDSSMDEGLRNLNKLHALENFVLHNAPFTDDGCEQFCGMSRLKQLHVCHTTISDAGLRHLANLHSLEYLNLQNGPVTDDGLVHLAGLHQLEHLNLSHTKVSDDGLVHLAGLHQMEHLNLSHTKVSDDGLVHLKGLEKLQWLDLADTQVSNAGLKQIASIKSLRYLSLGGSKVTVDGLAMVKNLDNLGPDFNESKQTVIDELGRLFPRDDVH